MKHSTQRREKDHPKSLTMLNVVTLCAALPSVASVSVPSLC